MNFKLPYELSVWKDDIINNVEVKIAIIGSDNMESPFRAFNVVLKDTLQGEKTLTFSMFYRWFNSETNENEDNPFIPILIPERKIKIRVGTAYDSTNNNDPDTEKKWIDFVIKEIEQSQEKNYYNVTCKEIYINELGRNGWSIILDDDLENNYGTLNELATYVLEDTDWQVDIDNYIATEYITVPLFFTNLTTSVSLTNIITGNSYTAPSGATLYISYNSIIWDDVTNTWIINNAVETQVFFNTDGTAPNYNFTSEQINDNRVLIDPTFKYNFILNTIISSPISITGGSAGNLPIQGNHIMRPIKIQFDSNREQYAYKYKVINAAAGVPVNTEVFRVEETNYITSEIVQNLITPNKDFISVNGWEPHADPENQAHVKLMPKPEGTDPSVWLIQNIKNLLILPFSSTETSFYNSSLKVAQHDFVVNNYYCVRAKFRWVEKGVDSFGTTSGLYNNIDTSNLPQINCYLYNYDSGTNISTIGQIITDDTKLITSYVDPNRGYYDPTYAPANRKKATDASSNISTCDDVYYQYVYLQITNTINSGDANIYLKFDVVNPDNADECQIEDIQFFKYYEDQNGEPIFIGDIPTSLVLTTGKYYYYDGVSTEPIWLVEDNSYYEPIYSEENNPDTTKKYSAIRHLEIKESTYFNIMQELAELFECFVKFEIDHYIDGRIYPGVTSPNKKVVFNSILPTSLNGGFVYGVNLKSIKRDLDSNEFSTKIIVKPNTQQYATDGACAISRAKSNYSGEDTIYNFDYYVNTGLLDSTQLIKDLYGTVSTDMAYFRKLGQINKEYNEKTELQIGYENELAIDKAYLETWINSIPGIDLELANQIYYWNNLPVGDTDTRNTVMIAIAQLQASKTLLQNKITEYQNKVNTYSTLLASIKTDINNLLNQKKLLNALFYAKYSRFLTEGSWVDNNYIDDELYYLDALKIASTSSVPKLSYTIDVLDINGIIED